MKSGEFYIRDGDTALHAQLDLPGDGAGKRPLVVVVHGFTGHGEERHIAAVARAVTDRGYAALRVELCGHGRSGGAFEDHTIEKWLDNLAAVIAYARGPAFVTDIYLCGHSQGGLAVLLAAARAREPIRGVIALSPAVMIPRLAREGVFFGTRFDPARIPDELSERHGRTLRAAYFRAAQAIRVEEEAARLRAPLLIVQGEADETVPARYAAALAELCPGARLVLIPGDDHLYTRHLDMVLDAVRAWLPDAE